MLPPKANNFVASCLHQANIANRFASNAIVTRKLKIITSATNGDQQLFNDNNKVYSVTANLPGTHSRKCVITFK